MQSTEKGASAASPTSVKSFLQVERDNYVSTSAPTSPVRIPTSLMDSDSPTDGAAVGCYRTGTATSYSTIAESPSSYDAELVSSQSLNGANVNALFSNSNNPNSTLSSEFASSTGQRHKGRSVKFPEDNAIVTGYHEAPDPYRYVVEFTNDVEAITQAYCDACVKQNIEPITSVLDQIKSFKCHQRRVQDLILRGEHLDARQCEALEEILKRVLFRLIDLDSCNLDCEGASALFDMIEFYESASHLSIANNCSIGLIGWQSLTRTLKKTACLQYLDLSNTGLNEQILLIMGRTIRMGSHLVTLRLENAGLFGRKLAILISAIKFNTSLRELYLGENKISSADCVQLANLLRGNGFLNVLDLRKNLIQDIGLDHICEGLAHQPSSNTVFELFQCGKCPQNSGILILNLSDNQLSSRAMNRLGQTLSQCRTLVGLDLSNNLLYDEGVIILKEGLIQCKTLKYLCLSNTAVSTESVGSVVDVINQSYSLSIVDLSNNDVSQDGFCQIRNLIRTNHRVTQLILLPQSTYPPYAGSKADPDFEEIAEEIDLLCERNKSETKWTEIDEILNGHLRSDISIYSEIEFNASETSNGASDDSQGEDDDESDASSRSPGHPRKPTLVRTASLGSWERPVKSSGRFSVSPVDMVQDEVLSPDVPEINIDVAMGGGGDGENAAVDMKSDTSDKEPSLDEENSSDQSHSETDQLTDLPSKGGNVMNRLVLPQRTFRRMSSPAVTGLPIKIKSKVNLTLKLSGNLESLDLKSSLPLSPTFFAKLDFSDPALIRLPADVEEITSRICLPDDAANEASCCNEFWWNPRPVQMQKT